MKVFICGKPRFKDLYEAAAFKIKIKGHEAVNPMDLTKILPPETTGWNQYMLATLGLLRACDAICLIEDYEHSRSGRICLEEAKRLGHKIYKSVDWVPERREEDGGD